MARLSEDEMYRAVINNDSAYDGVFFYAVKTTRIVCRPSCKSKAPIRANVCFFDTVTEALQQGYRPCKRCRPDIGHDYAPDLEIVRSASRIMDKEYSDQALLQKLPAMLGISASQLRRVFKAATGVTPRVYLQRIRVAKAIELADQQSMSAIDVSFAVGFNCLSSYYAALKNVNGLSRRAYRQTASAPNLVNRTTGSPSSGSA